MLFWISCYRPGHVISGCSQAVDWLAIPPSPLPLIHFQGVLLMNSFPGSSWFGETDIKGCFDGAKVSSM